MTKTQIANLAISHIGGRLLTDVDSDSTQEAIIIRAWFDAARDEFLRSYPWNFSTKRSRLTTTVDNVSGVTNVGGLFNIQTTTVHSLSTNDRVSVENADGNTSVNGKWYITVSDNRNFQLQDSQYSIGYSGGAQWSQAPTSEFDYMYSVPSDFERIIYVEHVEEPFVLERGKILCNIDKPIIKYVASNSDYSSWPQDAINALSYLLGSYIAQSINGPAGDNLKLRDVYEKIALPQAKFRDAKEMREKVIDRDQYSEVVQSRTVNWTSF